MQDKLITTRKTALWIVLVAVFGAAWNIFGLIQLQDFVMQTRQSLMMKGMSPVAAEVYYALPLWMKLAFAVGSFGGLIGSVLLFRHSRNAVPVFLASLVGYVALFAGDYAYGVFAVLPGQAGILSLVVGIAAVLLGAGLFANRQTSRS